MKTILPRSYFTILIAIFFSVTLISCGGAQKKADTEEKEQVAAISEEPTIQDSDSNTALGMQSIYYNYDAFRIRSDAKKLLQKNAELLKENAQLRIQIEGHCDERGSIQYNLALGEKRAQAARKALIRLGVEADRISTISYGKERPLNPDHNEAAWAKNRRANFVIVSK